jgi:hypothetical protein
LTKGILHHVSVQAGLDDFVRGPVEGIGDDDVFPELLDVLADAVVVFVTEQLPLVLVLLNRQVKEILGEIETLAGLRVVFFDQLGIGPIPAFSAAPMAANPPKDPLPPWLQLER